MLENPQKIIRIKVQDFKTKKLRIIETREKNMCWEGKRWDGKEYRWGVPHRDKKDCFRFCAISSCDIF